jgi:hypothetical protein
MKSVTEIFFTVVVNYSPVTDELKINSVAMVKDFVVFDYDISAVPKVNSIAGVCFPFSFTFDVVIRYNTVG